MRILIDKQKMRLNYYKRAGLVWSAAALLGGTLLCHAAPSTAKWLFSNREEMVELAPEHTNNLRATYHIIIRASTKNLATDAVLTYYDLLQKDENNPRLQAAFAFSHFVATGPLSQSYQDAAPEEKTKAIRKKLMEADYYRSEALKSRPNSAEVLLMTALPTLYQGSANPSSIAPGPSKAVEMLRKATYLEPKWADAQYWKATALNMLWPTVPKQQRAALGRESLSAAEKAEALEPNLKRECLIAKAYAYQAMNLPDKQLEQMDSYSKLDPESAKKPYFVTWRKAIAKQATQQK